MGSLTSGELFGGAVCGAALLVLGPMTVRALAADATDTRIVLGAEIALGGFAPAPPNFSVESRAAAFTDGGSAFGSDAAVELLAVLLARGSAAAASRFGSRTGTRLAAGWTGLCAI